MCAVRSAGGGPHEASAVGYVARGPEADEAAGLPDWLMPMTPAPRHLQLTRAHDDWNPQCEPGRTR
jgi:hypothetical protein